MAGGGEPGGRFQGAAGPTSSPRNLVSCSARWFSAGRFPSRRFSGRQGRESSSAWRLRRSFGLGPKTTPVLSGRSGSCVTLPPSGKPHTGDFVSCLVADDEPDAQPDHQQAARAGRRQLSATMAAVAGLTAFPCSRAAATVGAGLERLAAQSAERASAIAAAGPRRCIPTRSTGGPHRVAGAPRAPSPRSPPPSSGSVPPASWRPCGGTRPPGTRTLPDTLRAGTGPVASGGPRASPRWSDRRTAARR